MNKMNKIFDNKQMVHIVSEIIVLIALVYYVNQKNKKLLGYIEDLSQRIEEQEDKIENHETILRKIIDNLNRSNIERTREAVETQDNKAMRAVKPRKTVQKVSRKPLVQKTTRAPVPQKVFRKPDTPPPSREMNSFSSQPQKNSSVGVQIVEEKPLDWEKQETIPESENEDTESMLDLDIEEELRELEN